MENCKPNFQLKWSKQDSCVCRASSHTSLISKAYANAKKGCVSLGCIPRLLAYIS